jgi:hypothetical protein
MEVDEVKYDTNITLIPFVPGLLLLEDHNVQCLDPIIPAETIEPGKRNVQEKEEIADQACQAIK